LATDAVHELTAGYALDALDETERIAYERHLAHCERCQQELAELAASAASLAFAVEPAEPPPGLRERILETARAERPNVVPLRPSAGTWVLRGVAVAAVAAAVALAVWNVSLHDRLDRAQGALTAADLTGAAGSVVVGPSGQGTLVVAGLKPTEPGKTYEAWVIQNGKATPAGVFAGGKTAVVHLKLRVPHGAIIGVTVEPAGGSAQPTTHPIVTSGAV
jgi:anti-sigma-K factor RskA